MRKWAGPIAAETGWPLVWIIGAAAWCWTDQRITAWQEQGQRPIVAVWTGQQLSTFLNRVEGEQLSAMWWLIALCGLRRGEAAGLRWCDIDLNAGTLTIAQQRIAYGRCACR